MNDLDPLWLILLELDQSKKSMDESERKIHYESYYQPQGKFNYYNCNLYKIETKFHSYVPLYTLHLGQKIPT